MDEHVTHHQPGRLEALVTELERRWVDMAQTIRTLRDENDFLKEQVRDAEEKSRQFDARQDEVTRQNEQHAREKEHLAARIEALLSQPGHSNS